jgi:hypothetical protein
VRRRHARAPRGAGRAGARARRQPALRPAGAAHPGAPAAPAACVLAGGESWRPTRWSSTAMPARWRRACWATPCAGRAAVPRAKRSLSALTWAVHARSRGLSRWCATTSSSTTTTAREFDDIFRRRQLPQQGTVYVCAQDRGDGRRAGRGRERLLCLVNAPADGDRRPFDPSEIDPCEQRSQDLLQHCGLQLEMDAAAGGEHAGGLSPACSRARAGRCTAGERTAGWRCSEGRARPAACRGCTWPGAACTRGRGCRWRRCPAGWRPRRCWRTSIRPAGPAGGLSLVVRRRAQRRRPARADDHRLRRQRLLAVLRWARWRGRGRCRAPLRAQRRAVRPRRAPLDHDRARPRPAVRAARASFASARAACTGTAPALQIDIDEVCMPLPQRVRGRVRVFPQGLSHLRRAAGCGGRHRWGPIAPCARVEVDLDRPGCAGAAMPTWIRTKATSRWTEPSASGTGRAPACATAAPR